MSTPRYTEEQVRAIFERAARRQHAGGEGDAGGLTLEELQEIGAASGIDPAHVAAAASEVMAGPAEREALLGMPTVVRRTRHVAAPVSEAAWERMVAELRRQFDSPGIAGEVGRQREWTTMPSGARHTAPVRVAVEPEGAGSRITVEQSFRKAAWPFAIVGAAYSAVALLFGVLLAAGAFGSEGVFLPVMFAAMALLMFGGGQVGFRLYAARQERRFEGALDRLDLIARDGLPARTAAEAAEGTRPLGLPASPARPALDLDSLPDVGPDAEPARRASRRTRS